MSFTWDDAALEKLRDLRAAGYSAAETARAIGDGCTRGAVAGKWNRLGLSGETKSSVTRKENVAVRQATAEAAPVAPQDRPRGARDAIVALDSRSCRWPHGHPDEPGFHFCMARKSLGGPYCDKHARKAGQAYVPRRLRTAA